MMSSAANAAPAPHPPTAAGREEGRTIKAWLKAVLRHSNSQSPCAGLTALLEAAGTHGLGVLQCPSTAQAAQRAGPVPSERCV